MALTPQFELECEDPIYGWHGKFSTLFKGDGREERGSCSHLPGPMSIHMGEFFELASYQCSWAV